MGQEAHPTKHENKEGLKCHVSLMIMLPLDSQSLEVLTPTFVAFSFSLL
jgi:hypothetical protein